MYAFVGSGFLMDTERQQLETHRCWQSLSVRGRLSAVWDVSEAAYSFAEGLIDGEVKIDVISKDDVIRNKLASGREQSASSRYPIPRSTG